MYLTMNNNPKMIECDSQTYFPVHCYHCQERLLALPRPEFYYTRQGGEKEEMANSAVYTDEYDRY